METNKIDNKQDMNFSAVIFDMDGTLFNTEQVTIPLWEEAGIIFGYHITREIVIRMIGISHEKTREVLLNEFGSDFPYDDVCNEFRLIVKREFDKNGIPKKPGLDHILDCLTAAKIPMALATSTRKTTAVEMLEKAGILNRFTAVIGGDEIKNGKPAPDIFLLAAEKLGVSPSDCIGFEDSVAGLTALHAAGIRSVFIKDVIEPPQELLANVWRRCGDLFEAAEFVSVKPNLQTRS
ncbi:MAG: HAD family phosphatase [Treponema sp.]|jgi:HAD superfamily hydrolase (TIGR01509 family)|nr:HAD family phosphatase [Treponema sp.]